MKLSDEPPECRFAIERLNDYLDDELSEENRRRIRQHLDHCAECFPLFNFEQHFHMLVRAKAGKPRAPETLRQRILQEILRDPDGQE